MIFKEESLGMYLMNTKIIEYMIHIILCSNQ